MYDKTGKIADRREMLKVKTKSLAAEAKIIRKEEKKAGTLRYVLVPARPATDKQKFRDAHWRRVRMDVNPLAHELWAHRTKHVRSEARLTHVAYGLIRGRSYEKMEQTVRKQNQLTEADWKRVYEMCKKYGADGVDYGAKKAA